MRILFSLSFRNAAKLSLLGITFFAASICAVATPAFPPEEANKLLPALLGDFKAASPGIAFDPTSEDRLREFNAISATTRSYKSKRGETFFVSLVLTRSDASAYALLTSWSPSAGVENATLPGLETSSTVFPGRVQFAKGRTYVDVQTAKDNSVGTDLKNLGQLLAETLDKGEGDIPALVKHLPDWQNIQHHILYVVSLDILRKTLGNQPVLDALSFEGGAAAVIGNYGDQRLVIIEFNTPQIATTNDQKIVARVSELKASIPAPDTPSVPGYRRVGNYAVFVFDAPNEQAANELIDQVKYQQVVQWLGENPYSYERATREFTETTLGVLVSVVKTSGLALVACLAVGGFFGALLFRSRRAQQRTREAYVDADAMLRLNLDELTPESESTRLLGRHN